MWRLEFHQARSYGGFGKPSITGREDFDAKDLAKDMEKALTSTFVDARKIVDIMGTCTLHQRLLILEAYGREFDEDLRKVFKEKLHDQFETLCVYLLLSWPELNAKALYDALEGGEEKLAVVIEILCTLPNEELQAVTYAYQELLQSKGKGWGQSLLSDIKEGLDGNLETLMVALIEGHREPIEWADAFAYANGTKTLEEVVDMEKVMADVEMLKEAADRSFDDGDPAFIITMVSRNKFHLEAISKYYEQEYGETLLELIENEASSEIRKALALIFKGQTKPILAYSEMIHDTMEGFGTRDKKLMRLVITRTEIDLADINDFYKEKYGRSLSDTLEFQLSREYGDLMVKLCGESKWGF